MLLSSLGQSLKAQEMHHILYLMHHHCHRKQPSHCCWLWCFNDTKSATTLFFCLFFFGLLLFPYCCLWSFILHYCTQCFLPSGYCLVQGSSKVTVTGGVVLLYFKTQVPIQNEGIEGDSCRIKKTCYKMDEICRPTAHPASKIFGCD